MKNLILILVLSPLLIFGQQDYTLKKKTITGVLMGGSSGMNLFTFDIKSWVHKVNGGSIHFDAPLSKNQVNEWAFSIGDINLSSGGWHQRLLYGVTLVTFSSTNNYGMYYNVFDESGNMGAPISFFTHINAWRFANVKIGWQPFNFTPKSGLSSRTNIFPFPRLYVYLYSYFLEYSRISSLPFTYFTKNDNGEYFEVRLNSPYSYLSLFDKIGIEIDFDLGQALTLFWDWRYDRGKVLDFASKLGGQGVYQDEAKEHTYLTIRPQSEWKAGIRAKFPIAFNDRFTQTIKQFPPKLQISAINTDGSSRGKLTPHGVHTIDVLVNNSSQKGTANIKEWSVSFPDSGLFEFTRISLDEITINPGQSRCLRFRIISTNAPIGKYKFNLSLSGENTSSFLEIELEVAKDAKFQYVLKKNGNISRQVPSVYKIADELANNLSTLNFTEGYKIAIFWMGPSKLGEYIARLTSEKMPTLTLVKNGKEPLLDYLDPAYIISGNVTVEDINGRSILNLNFTVLDRFSKTAKELQFHVSAPFTDTERSYLELMNESED